MENKSNVYTPKQLGDLTGGSSENFNLKSIEKIIEKSTGFIEKATTLIKQVQTVKSLTKPIDQQGDGNANAKFEKGLEQGKKQAQKPEQIKPIIAYHIDDALKEVEILFTAYLNQIPDDKTAKELKEEIRKSLKEPKKIKIIIENLMKKHTEIFYNEN